MKIKLRNKKGKVVGYATIDPIKYGSVKNFRWHLTRKGYVATSVYHHKDGVRTVLLHRFLLDLPRNRPWVDHINRNKLDCRMKNLRIASASLNSLNRDLQKNNKSGVTGVYLRTRMINGHWYSYWVASYGRKHLGQFKYKSHAVKARTFYVDSSR